LPRDFLRGLKNMNKELVDYIKQQTEINISRNEITDILLQQGWHQSEIDEAFAQAGAADGGEAIFGKEFDAGPEQGNGGGAGKKALLFVLPIAAVLLLAAGAMIFISQQNSPNSQNEPTETPTAVEENSAPANAVVEDQPQETVVAGQNQADPVLLAEIAKLEKSIVPPAGWTGRQGTVSYRPLAVFFKPVWEKDAAGENIFNENINILRDILSSSEEEYLAKAKTALQSNIENYKIISDRKVSLKDGTQATLIGGSFTQNGTAMKNMQLYAVKGSDIYIITGVTLAENWDAEKDMIGEAVLSFAFPEN